MEHYIFLQTNISYFKSVDWILICFLGDSVFHSTEGGDDFHCGVTDADVDHYIS